MSRVPARSALSLTRFVGGERRRADSVHLGNPAPVGAADEELGRAAAGALPTGHLNGRLPGGAGGTAGQGRTEPVAGGDFQTDGREAGRVRALAEARSVGAAIRVRVGRRRLPAGSSPGLRIGAIKGESSRSDERRMPICP